VELLEDFGRKDKLGWLVGNKIIKGDGKK